MGQLFAAFGLLVLIGLALYGGYNAYNKYIKPSNTP